MIDVALTVEEAAHARLAGALAVVIDAVRASTTIVTALAHGARAVVPVATPAEALVRARILAAGSPAGAPAPLLGGERGGAPPPGFECGNSPAEYTPARVAGRTVVFTTTNGTRGLLAARGAAGVVVAGFVNAGAVVRWLGGRPEPAVLVCAGEVGRFCLEDAACAGLLVDRLTAGGPRRALSDGARAAQRLYRSYGPDREALLAEATWARELIDQGRGDDLPLCTVVDAYDVVPVLRDGALERWSIDTAGARPP